MGVNKSKPHIFVLPEDDANRQLANGFHLQVDWDRQRQLQVLKPAGGWNDVLSRFNLEHVIEMERYPDRFMVLLIDFDNKQDRLEMARSAIPNHLADRVFVLGALSDPEVLKGKLGPYEMIGSQLADDCRRDTYRTWEHSDLLHNANELARLREYVRPILF